MTSLINKIIEAHLSGHILTDGDLHNLMGKTPAARYAAVNKALKKIYCVTHYLSHISDKLPPFFVAYTP